MDSLLASFRSVQRSAITASLLDKQSGKGPVMTRSRVWLGTEGRLVSIKEEWESPSVLDIIRESVTSVPEMIDALAKANNLIHQPLPAKR